MFLVLGNFTYNEVIEFKFMGINKDMSKYRNQKALGDEINNFGSIQESEDLSRKNDMFEEAEY